MSGRRVDEGRKALDPALVCTCNDLYVGDIEEAVHYGEVGYKEIFAVHDMAPRCCGCIDHVTELVKRLQAR